MHAYVRRCGVTKRPGSSDVSGRDFVRHDDGSGGYVDFPGACRVGGMMLHFYDILRHDFSHYFRH